MVDEDRKYFPAIIALGCDKLERAAEDLGSDFGGFSPVDLLLDQCPNMAHSVASALVDIYTEGRNGDDALQTIERAFTTTDSEAT